MKIVRHILLFPRILSLYKSTVKYYLDKLNLIGSRKELVLVKLRNSLKFKIHAGNSDINSINEFFLSRIYAKILSEIKPSFNVVDIGANIGIVSVGIASRLTTGKVFALEPNPMIYGLLKDNVELNGFENRVFIYQSCVSARRERRDLYFEPLMWGGASINVNRDIKSNLIKFGVECIGLDDIFELIKLRYIDFLKIDVEGAEQEILSNAKKDTLKKIKRILVEYHEPYVSAREIKKILENNNFAIEQSNDLNAFYAINTKSGEL